MSITKKTFSLEESRRAGRDYEIKLIKEEEFREYVKAQHAKKQLEDHFLLMVHTW